MNINRKNKFKICKNRYDGDLGKMLIKFDKETLSFSSRNSNNQNEETKDQEILLINSSNTDITNLNNEISLAESFNLKKNISNKK